MIEESPRFESFRAPRRDDRWKDCHAALYDRQLGKFIAGAYVKRQELITASTKYFWDRRVAFRSDSEVTWEIYQYWLFSSKLDFNSPDWVFELQSAGKEIPLLFTPRFPFIRFSDRGARLIAVDLEGNVLAERVEVWKDSDSRRGALCQFNIERPDAELSMIAVLTLFLHSVYQPPFFA